VKRFICILLVLALLISGFMLSVQAETVPELSISSGSAKPGESVLLHISIKDNPGIAATIVYVYYDTETFTADPGKDLSAAGAFALSGGVIGNTIALAKENGRYEGKAGKDGVLALWYNGTGTDTDSDGVMLTLRLHVKEDAANGDYTIQADVPSGETINEKDERLSVVTTNGTVTVTGGSKEKEPDKEPTGKELEAVPEFHDVSGNWAEDYIKQAAELGLIEGYQGLYRPNDTMTRAEFVTILWRAMGEPRPTKAAAFTDLTQNWYLDAVAWAEENAVVNGMGEGKFAPNGTVTREQMVTIFHRLAGKPVGAEVMFTGIYDAQYPDSGSVGSWAKSALYWSVYNGIYCGVDAEEIGSHLQPKSPATRAQIAVMIVRYLDMSE